MSSRALVDPGTIPPSQDINLVRVYVWEWPVRFAHWLIAVTIVLNAVTGIYIGHPFLIVPGPANRHFVMGTARTIHLYFGILFALAVLFRIYWMFAGNRFAKWDKFLPVHRHRREGIRPTLKFYLFALRKPPGFVGHNPLAGSTYTLVFLLYFVMIATGLALYQPASPVRSPFHVFSFFVPLFGGLQGARWIHHAVMWLLLGFAVHHVYSAVLMSQVEANATLESIFSGYKFVPREDVIYSGYCFLDPKDDDA
jgi:Ni/Fe-hydrogenase 1 B-type cytochrome subunit